MIRASEQALRMNRREIRARQLVAHTLHALRDCIPETALQDAHNVLYELFLAKGVEVLTDEDRRQAGLEPRDDHGWTPSELLALDRIRLELMLKPLRSSFVRDTEGVRG